MLQNPIHLRLEKLEGWQHVTFMACLCERMYPNYAMFCKQTEFGEGQIYRRILDLIWETLTEDGLVRQSATTPGTLFCNDL
jgi:uncharacterized protein YjaG (DUF416 family)